MRVPVSAVTKERPGAPAIEANGSSGLSACPKAKRPHGKPPNGIRLRSASAVTHAPAIHTGERGARPTATASTPNTPNASASIAANANQGVAPPYRSEEHTSELPSLMRTSYAVLYLTTKHN